MDPMGWVLDFVAHQCVFLDSSIPDISHVIRFGRKRGIMELGNIYI